MGIDRARLAGELATLIAEDPAVSGFPARLCQLCVEVLPVDGVGISLMTRDDAAGRVILAASDDMATKIEQLQFSLGEGPCVSAFGDAQPVLVPDVHSADAQARWPMFTSKIGVEAGALFAFPLQVGSIGIGVLDCHRQLTGSLGEVSDALLVAELLTQALLDFQARDTPASGSGVDLFDVSWSSNAEIHQATGMVASQLDVSTEEAFVRLRAYAFRQRTPLRAVANDILSRRIRFDDGRQ